MERKDLPKVAVLLATRAGSVADPSGKRRPGRLDDGDDRARDARRARRSRSRTRSAISGTRSPGLEGASDPGSSFDVLKRNLAPAMAIFANVVRQSCFSRVGSGSRKENARGCSGARGAGTECNRISRERHAGFRRRTPLRPPMQRGLPRDRASADQSKIFRAITPPISSLPARR